MRDLIVDLALGGFPYATGWCPEHMCQGTDAHPGDHYIQRKINGKTLTTFWHKP